MRRFRSSSAVASAATLLTLVLIACMTPDGAFVDPNGEVLLATPEEVEQARQTLLSIDSEADMSPSMEGGVLFDGDVSDIERRADGSEVAAIRIVKLISGPLTEGGDVRVQTPSAERGGVRFEIGRRFRVFAVEIDGELRTWASAGTDRIDGR